MEQNNQVIQSSNISSTQQIADQPNISNNLRQIIVGPGLENYQQLVDYPIIPPENKSLLAKYLTPDVWKELENQEDISGFSFKQAIFKGLKITDSQIGVIAGHEESYKKFAPLFNLIINDYHQPFNVETDFHPPLDLDHTKLLDLGLKFEDDEAIFIKSTRIRFARNIKGMPLQAQVTLDQRAQIEEMIVNAGINMDGEHKCSYYSLSKMSKEEINQLIDDHYLYKEQDRFQEAGYIKREWPQARGILMNEEKTFLMWVNEEDHLRVISMQQGADFIQVLKRLREAQQKLDRYLQFSHDPHLGYIASCPSNIGTGLRASFHIHLPLLGQRKDEFEAIASEYYVQIRGANGEHTETNDHIYDVSNKRRLGSSEVELVKDMFDGVKAMIQREKQLAIENVL
eukprot:403372271